MRHTIEETGLDLTGLTILTEAASGAYTVTPIIAALANAKHVYAVTRSGPYGSFTEITKATMDLARVAGVAEQISISDTVPEDVLGEINLVTNSGNLRPLNTAIISQLPPQAVIALMFEAWEFRPQDINAEACVRYGIPVIGVNEHHPAVDVFSFLGPLAVKLLHDADLPVYRNRIAVLCDNGFDEPIMRGLSGLGAHAHCYAKVEDLREDSWDAILVALKPASAPRIGKGEIAHLRAVSPPGTLIAQFWGDIDRDALQAAGMRIWPSLPPRPGHMAILLSSIGPEPIIRLQTGGLRAAEWVLRGGAISADGFAQPVKLQASCV